MWMVAALGRFTLEHQLSLLKLSTNRNRQLVAFAKNVGGVHTLTWGARRSRRSSGRVRRQCLNAGQDVGRIEGPSPGCPLQFATAAFLR
jgi:hypothetical protein